MSSFNVAGYFFNLPHNFFTLFVYKNILMANILKIKTFDKTRINFFQHIKKSIAQLLSVKSIGHVNLGSFGDSL